MPRRSKTKTKPRPRPVRKAARQPGVRWLRLLAPVTLIVGSMVVWSLAPTDTAALRDRAEAEALAGRWSEAVEHWRAFNQTPDASASSLLAEAEAHLQLDRAADAERALRLATAADPSRPDPWLTRLELLRLEDRPVDALQVGWTAYESVPVSARVGVLRALTLALLADVPDPLALDALGQFLSADPDDLDARVALLDRQGSSGQAGGRPTARASGLEERIKILAALLDRNPEHVAARAALVATLADAGHWDDGRAWLDTWPESARDDPRYLRLLGRYELDFEGSPARAVESLRKALAILPHDWKARARLAQALRAAGQEAEAHDEARIVDRHQEILDPARLGPRLAEALEALDQPDARLDLARLCESVGLDRLALAWSREAKNVVGARAEE